MPLRARNRGAATHARVCDLTVDFVFSTHLLFRFKRQSDYQYKSSLCTKWAATGQCENGSKCRYAHGREDLRSANG